MDGGETVKDAGNSLISVVQLLVDLFIWITIVVLPFLLLFALFVWGALKLFKTLQGRRDQHPASEPADEERTQDRR